MCTNLVVFKSFVLYIVNLVGYITLYKFRKLLPCIDISERGWGMIGSKSKSYKSVGILETLDFIIKIFL